MKELKRDRVGPNVFCEGVYSECVCARDASKRSASCFWSYYNLPLSLPRSLSLTLYSDCLQARRHFPVKVSLMNSNDPTDCLRQVIHNHSSFTFPPPHHPSATSSLAFFSLHLPPLPVTVTDSIS